MEWVEISLIRLHSPLFLCLLFSGVPCEVDAEECALFLTLAPYSQPISALGRLGGRVVFKSSADKFSTSNVVSFGMQ